jgi:hypothetical protein
MVHSQHQNDRTNLRVTVSGVLSHILIASINTLPFQASLAGQPDTHPATTPSKEFEHPSGPILASCQLSPLLFQIYIYYGLSSVLILYQRSTRCHRRQQSTTSKKKPGCTVKHPIGILGMLYIFDKELNLKQTVSEGLTAL